MKEGGVSFLVSLIGRCFTGSSPHQAARGRSLSTNKHTHPSRRAHLWLTHREAMSRCYDTLSFHYGVEPRYYLRHTIFVAVVTYKGLFTGQRGGVLGRGCSLLRGTYATSRATCCQGSNSGS